MGHSGAKKRGFGLVVSFFNDQNFKNCFDTECHRIAPKSPKFDFVRKNGLKKSVHAFFLLVSTSTIPVHTWGNISARMHAKPGHSFARNCSKCVIFDFWGLKHEKTCSPLFYHRHTRAPNVDFAQKRKITSRVWLFYARIKL